MPDEVGFLDEVEAEVSPEPDPDYGEWIVDDNTIPSVTPRRLEWSYAAPTADARRALQRAEEYLRRSLVQPTITGNNGAEEERMPETTLDIDVVHLLPSSPGYGARLRESFQFFRRHAQNRYSASSLMRLANAAGEFDERTRQGTESSPRTSALLPELTVASRPSSYDEDTEVKNGGVVGMMVTWPDGKSLFAVISSSRRQGVGRQIFTRNRYSTSYTPYFWVGTSNVPAQQFLLAMGLEPTALNGNGAVRYGYSGGEE